MPADPTPPAPTPIHEPAQQQQQYEEPTDEDTDDALLAARYGDTDDLRAFVARFGPAALQRAADPNGNTLLHMAAANGHTDVLTYLLPLLPSPHPALLSQNTSGSTPLHWAALNAHLPALQALVEFPRGPGAALVDARDKAGRSALAHAEERGWEAGARWLVGVMRIEGDAVRGDDGSGEGDGEEGGEGEGEEDGEGEEGLEGQEIEVEIEDADGGIARLSLAQPVPPPPAPPPASATATAPAPASHPDAPSAGARAP